MKIIGVLSDTHIRPGGRRVLPPRIFDDFKGVDLILHAGDVNTLPVITELETIAPVIAVHGNNDDWEAMQQLKTIQRVPVEETIIGLTHGDVPAHGALARPLEIAGNRQTAANALSHFADDANISCIVFGHSHRPCLAWHEVGDGRKVLLLNPGSPTDKRYGPHHACAILQVDGARLKAELITW